MSELLTPEIKENLDNKLETLNDRFQKLQEKLSDPEVVNNSRRYAKLAKEHGSLSKFAEKFETIQELKERRREAEELRDETDDEADMQELAREELQECENRLERLYDEVMDMLVQDAGSMDRDIIVEIRPGTGGDEAALFARDLFRMYSRYAEKKGWKIEQLSANVTDMGGFKEIIFSVKGDGAWSTLRYESGGHRVQRVPETESQGRIHTSLATVAVLPEAREVEVEIDEDDLDVSFTRSGGPGGQKVNMTASCVRIVHEPTGITVRCQDETSQHKNRKKAMRILRARVHEKLERERREKREALRRQQVGTGDRSQKVRTYNFPQDRVTDHRVGVDVYDIEGFMMGDCDEIFDALAAYDKRRRLEEMAANRG